MTDLATPTAHPPGAPSPAAGPVAPSDQYAASFQETERTWAKSAFNPFDPAFIKDPYPTYRRLLEAGLVKHPIGVWLCPRYESARNILSDTRRFGKGVAANRRRAFEEYAEMPIGRFMTNMMLTLNPPDHTRMRGLVAKAFTAKRMEEMRGPISARVERMLDGLVGRGEMDLVSSFSHPLPVNVICDLMGIPESERHRFERDGRVTGRAVDPTPMSPDELRAANEGILESMEWWRGFFEMKRADPSDDLTTALLRARDNDDKLTEIELFANAMLLFGAGHETTVNLITNSIVALCRNPDQMAILREDSSLMPGAVEEFLRYDSSVQMTGRMAFEDVELEDQTIAKGETVMLVLGAANHDPRVFPNPERLDVRRPNVRPLSFGGGIHFCLGAQLARIQGAIAIAALLRRLPGLRLADPEDVPMRPTFTLRGASSVRVVWDA